MFQDGRCCAVLPASVTYTAAVLGPRTQHLALAITLRRATFQNPFSCSKNRCWPRESPERRPREAAVRNPHVGRNTLPFQQFHVLFHSLFKVLFIFPSLYLFAIGLSPVFSFRWNLPPTWSCIPKQLDSSAEFYAVRGAIARGSHPLRRPVPRNVDSARPKTSACKLQRPRAFKFELLPLHSPLLRQSRLVSFPPLIDMLKFSG